MIIFKSIWKSRREVAILTPFRLQTDVQCLYLMFTHEWLHTSRWALLQLQLATLCYLLSKWRMSTDEPRISLSMLISGAKRIQICAWNMANNNSRSCNVSHHAISGMATLWKVISHLAHLQWDRTNQRTRNKYQYDSKCLSLEIISVRYKCTGVAF